MRITATRAGRRHLAACGVFFAGLVIVVLCGVSLVSLVGSLVAAAGSIAMGATAARAGA